MKDWTRLTAGDTFNSYHPALKRSRALQAAQDKAKSRQLSSWRAEQSRELQPAGSECLTVALISPVLHCHMKSSDAQTTLVVATQPVVVLLVLQVPVLITENKTNKNATKKTKNHKKNLPLFKTNLTQLSQTDMHNWYWGRGMCKYLMSTRPQPLVSLLIPDTAIGRVASLIRNKDTRKN